MSSKDRKPSRPDETPESGNWLSRTAPGVRRMLARRETPDELWVKCPDTAEMIYRPDLEAALWVTPAGRHMRIAPALRLAFTFDDGVYERLETPRAPQDPLGFPDKTSYPDKLLAARKASGEDEAMALAAGTIGGQRAVVAVQNFAFMGGSLSPAVGEAFIAGAREAVARKAAFIVFTASGGARMQEGTLSLMQLARTTLAIQELKRARLPYIVVLTDPTTAGVMASYAMLGDIHIAEPGALIAFTGARVIKQTIGQTLPEGYQTAEFLEDHGVIDRIVPRGEMAATLGSILRVLLK
ncbi:acetyl-CoA carboxylase carboxyl transferase subunit beta [Caulobacter ginsengisoli]|uniref:Acetyl-coenzyme A carboxylase carboxyl transferase subunit beta n=1 Tax=Caulobacter ginsengisoli TaxID=400775 RepID=A0ABU0J0M2_9CAUL|nr:acetyl-CoA carboxylase carboxyltransferase subunit beta [Caulobacter ginsengisoli]MDQ0466844.1 acetyl-CoA carboxylase carboxyl transferase subunit beta [Caulobacter ginsengisoli]